MLKIPLTVDYSGYAYDPENPTREAEKLCFRLNQLLSNLATAGVEVRQIETADATIVETEVERLINQYRATPGETMPAYAAISDPDVLLDEGLGLVLNEARKAWLKASIGRWLSQIEGEETTVESILAEMVDVQKLMLTQETILYLSDGTPIYGHTGLVA